MTVMRFSTADQNDSNWECQPSLHDGNNKRCG